MSQRVKHWICFALFRFLLPVVLLAASIFRFSGFSLLYGCLALINPLIYRPTHNFLRKHSGRYLIAVVVLCTLTALSQACFQIYLAVANLNNGSNGPLLTNCSSLESILRQVGLQSVEPGNYVNILRVTLPDVCSFLVSLFVFICCRLLLTHPVEPGTPPRVPASTSSATEEHTAGAHPPAKTRMFRFGVVLADYTGTFLVVLFIGLCGIATPSILTAVYFIVFLVVATLWACCIQLGDTRWFLAVKKVILVYAALHLLAIYLSQFQFVSELWGTTPNHASLIERIIGLPRFIEVDCDKPWFIHIYPDVKWTSYLGVSLVLGLYFTVAIEVRRRRDKLHDAVEVIPLQVSSAHVHQGSASSSIRRRRSDSSAQNLLHDDPPITSISEHQGLIDDDGSMHNYHSMDPREELGGYGDAGADQSRLRDVPRQRSRFTESMKGGGVGEVIFGFVLQHSYILTLIVMMSWSITYHSWLTFAFLIFACLIWIIPQKRIICLRSSPVIVFYAESLLILEYIYGFNLNDAELPSSLPNNYSLEEIGLVKHFYPFVHLAAKVAFTFIFWLTLRQFTGECIEQRRRDHQIERAESMDTLDGVGTDEHAKKRSFDSMAMKNLLRIATWGWDVLSKYWIFVCAALFLLMALQEAVVYRIIYMVLFLYLIITFQLSYTFWRFCVKAFWTIVILYSMIVLVILYVFQFKDISTRWRNATGMSKQLMDDIGLKQYPPGQLFVELLTPTSFLIFIILHLHYFQKTFLQLSDVNRFKNETPSTTVVQDSSPTQEQPRRPNLSKQKSVDHRPSLFTSTCRRLSNCYHTTAILFWRYLEVHIHKLVVLAVFVLCVHEVSAMNVFLVLLIIVLLPFLNLQRLVSIVSLFYCSAVILVKMIYQLQVVQPGDSIDGNCSLNLDVNSSTRIIPWQPVHRQNDSALYLGLEKTTNLSCYLKDYVLVVLLLGFQAVIRVHQIQHNNNPKTARIPHGIVFTGIHRTQADLGLWPCTQFLVNYGFYKFGKEICFVMTVITMVVRLDMYSILYGLILGGLVLMRRKTCYRVWPIYVILLIVLIVLQYLACLGIPLALCIEYPWDSDAIATNLRIFLYLPSYLSSEKPQATKLICDFFQLLFICLQWKVFTEENEPSVETKGGFNRSIFLQLKAKKKKVPTATLR